MAQKLIVVAAPSGSGKTTIVKKLLQRLPGLAFSVSACTRAARAGEKEGVDYYFLSESAFQEKINEDAFLEWEMVYPGMYYGTLTSEITRITKEGRFPLVDIDVKGAITIMARKEFQTLSVFIKTPSLEELSRRLRNRGTETDESLEQRIEKAAFELSFEQYFNHTVVNDNLEYAVEETTNLVKAFLDQNNK